MFIERRREVWYIPGPSHGARLSYRMATRRTSTRVGSDHPAGWASREDLLPLYMEIFEAHAVPEHVRSSFAWYFGKLCANETGILAEEEITPVDPTTVPAFDGLTDYAERGAAELGRCAVAKLNGGLGTGMGLAAAKSLLPVKGGHSFLNIITRQVEHLRRTRQVAMPVLFMNSFSTDSDTVAALSGFAGNPDGIPLTFLQSRFPKVLADSGKPAVASDRPQLAWNPPGHGEFYSALRSSGALRALLDADIRYLFVSNADNLGATLSPEVLGYMAANEVPFVMEVTERTPNDRKGGHLACSGDGRLILREAAQCRASDMDHFQDISRHRLFNTNNLWVDLSALDRELAATPVLDLPMIRNTKTLDPADRQSPTVFQLETAMGTAISLFHGAQAVVVPRSRFLPVKKTSDLILLRSDRYTLSEDFSIVDNRPEAGTCVVELDPDYYEMIAQFDERFPAGVPSLIDCAALSVDGDVAFGAGVRCVGEVRIRNRSGRQITVGDNETISDAVDF